MANDYINYENHLMESEEIKQRIDHLNQKLQKFESACEDENKLNQIRADINQMITELESYNAD